MKRKREKGGAGGNRICKISNRIDQITSFKIPKLDIYAALERKRERERRKEKIRSMKIFIRASRTPITGILEKLNFIFYRLLGPEHTTAEY